MSYQDALRDGVEIGTHNWQICYYPKCRLCGKKVMTHRYTTTQRYTCGACRRSQNPTAEELAGDNARAVVQNQRLEKALDRISKIADLKEYEAGIRWVRKRLGRACWFESTEEIMAALELMHCGVKARYQVKILRYRVDFLLPDDRIVLEIDGPVFHHRDARARENERDRLILQNLGEGWDVIRVPTANINQNVTRLYPALRAAKDRRNRLREESGGKVPAWYTDRAT